MSPLAIPPASLDRLRTAYANFEQMALVIAEAMGIDPRQPYRLDLQTGVFVVDEPEMATNGQVSHGGANRTGPS